MAGQSNMEGWDSPYSELDQATLEKYIAGHENVKINVKSHGEGATVDTGTNFVDVSFGLGATSNYIGPEVGLAYYLGQNDPGTTYYLIKSSRGGSSLDWDWASNGPSYNNFVADVNAALNALTSQGYNPEIIGMIWLQGCSDCDDGSVANPPYSGGIQRGADVQYETNELALIARIKAQFSTFINEDTFIWVDGAISESGWPQNATVVNAAKASICATNDHYVFVQDGKTLAKTNSYHYTAASQLVLGEAFGKAICDLLA